MKYFPAFFDLAAQPVLIVGAGEVALRKLALLEKCGARVTVVAPQVHAGIQARAAAGTLRLLTREFEPDDLERVRLAIVATSRRALNRWIAKLADRRGIPVNVVDDREASRFIVPAIVDRDPVTVAVCTAGTSPVLARRLRERLEAFFPQRFGELALWLADIRRQAVVKLRDTAARRRYFEDVIDGPAARRLIEGDRRGAERIAQQFLASTAQAPPPRGEVTLVGAGPGDPELLTLKALRALQDADVVLYDRLVSSAVLDMARRDALRICVGKAAHQPSTAQADIHALLIEHALAGRRVVRLKGGDPFVFGRGGEELQALAAAGIAFSVVPGITAAIGAAAYAGIPLTHRQHAHAVTFVTGHADEPGQEPNWAALVQPGQTVVFYMGLARIEHISRELQAHGAPASFPAALVAQATLPDQRVVNGTLATIASLAATAKLASPALLVIGEVTALSSQLGWFSNAALAAERHQIA
ncbi:MAG: uroporphyrinogen-III C-methyltransferase [Proteobacteria bacterium]|nr:uroporphyrinogen-III C-methyltransferase [Pseudomonadota bacterium]